MTELTMEREQIQLPRSLVTVLTVILMGIAIWGAGSLLNWAVKGRLLTAPVVESSQITAEVREKQLACLAKNIYYEAGSEPFEGKVAVAQVTLNRVESGQFPGDICQTIYQKNVVYQKVICQFSWTCDRVTGPKPIHKVNYDQSMEVAKKVLLEGFRLPSLEKALYYHADYVSPKWNRERITKIGRHIFYK